MRLAFAGLTSTYLFYPTVDFSAIGLAAYLVAQSLLWLYLYPHRRRVGLAGSAAGLVVALLAARLSAPLFEDDYFRYLWDGNQVVSGSSPYAEPPLSAPAHGLGAIRERINFPHLVTLYPPLTQLLFGLTRLLSGPRPEAFLWILVLSGAGLFALALRRLCRGRNVEHPDLTVLWILQHPLLVKEWYQSCHYDVWVAAAFVGGLAARDWRRGVGLALAANLKLTGIVGLAWLGRPRPRVALVTLLALLAPWAIFHGELGKFWDTLREFGTGWEMNSGPFRLARGIFGAGFLPRGAMLALWLAAAAALLRARLAEEERAFWIFFLMVWLSPVVNPWYFTWCLGLAVVLPAPRRQWALGLFTWLPAYYLFYAPTGFPFVRFWDLEHVAIGAGLWMASRQRAVKATEPLGAGEAAAE